jgi:hypothetical protein
MIPLLHEIINLIAALDANKQKVVCPLATINLESKAMLFPITLHEKNENKQYTKWFALTLKFSIPQITHKSRGSPLYFPTNWL